MHDSTGEKQGGDTHGAMELRRAEEEKGGAVLRMLRAREDDIDQKGEQELGQ